MGHETYRRHNDLVGDAEEDVFPSEVEARLKREGEDAFERSRTPIFKLIRLGRRGCGHLFFFI